jgi:hypothetical protein
MLLTHSRVFRVVKESVEKARDFIKAPPADPSPEVDEPETSIYKAPADPTLAEAWRNTEGVLLKFRDEVRASGSEFWLATLYNLPQVDPEVSHRRTLEASLGVDSLFYPDHRLASFAHDHQIPVISLAEPLADYTAAHHVYISGGNSANAPLGTGHWNKTGASEAASIAASQLCRESSVLR